jgi:hypothetical protein
MIRGNGLWAEHEANRQIVNCGCSPPPRMVTADQREARDWSRRDSEAPFLSYLLESVERPGGQARAGFARRSGPLTARTVLQAVSEPLARCPDRRRGTNQLSATLARAAFKLLQTHCAIILPHLTTLHCSLSVLDERPRSASLDAPSGAPPRDIV